MMQDYLQRILRARVYDVAIESPLDHAKLLSAKLNNHVYIKREDLQRVFSFKLRGAYNKVASLSAAERQRGIITASAGNHAQGVALAAQHTQCDALIVMPEITSEIKINAVKALGAEIRLAGKDFYEAQAVAVEIAEREGRCLVHPYDDPDVIAGQGTVAVEILRQFSGTPDAMFVPVGGGGLLAGMVAYIKSIAPEVKMFGVEPEDAACLKAALDANERVVLDEVGIFADGTAVAQIGKETFSILRDNVDGVITVNVDEMCAAIKDVFDDTRSIAEPAGVLSIAGLKKYVEQQKPQQQNLIAICSGANINFHRLRHISERTEISEGHEIILSVKIPERPGSFLEFCETLGGRNITEFNYRYADRSQAHIFVGVQTTGKEERHQLIKAISDKDYQVLDLTDNEIAKLHVRHMVGGHTPTVVQEVVYRCEFPERQGALLQFLRALNKDWNISLFHYRNHGSDRGRILVGLQVDGEQRSNIEKVFKQYNLPYWHESDNPAYTTFLG